MSNSKPPVDPHGDRNAVRIAATADLSTKQRLDIWKNRFDNSGAIEREFFSVAVYAAHMENLFKRHVHGEL
jgi:hypothetical protein